MGGLDGLGPHDLRQPGTAVIAESAFWWRQVATGRTGRPQRRAAFATMLALI
jgi:hypothetical protein